MTLPRTQRRTRPTDAHFERGLRADLAGRRWLRVHVSCIALATLCSCWALSALLLRGGVHGMALRHAVALLGAYGVYLGLMHLWARWLLRRDERRAGDVLDTLQAGSDVVDIGEGLYGGGGSGASDVMSGVLEAVGSADEAALVAVPLAVVVGVALLLGAALGFAVFGLFGIDVLLGVAVEIAFASAGGALALKARREGWLLHVVRRTAGPMAVVLAATVAAGFLIGHWLPEANTLQQAWQLWRGR